MSVYIAAPPRASNNITNINGEGTRESINYNYIGCVYKSERKFPMHEIKKILQKIPVEFLTGFLVDFWGLDICIKYSFNVKERVRQGFPN